jgi:hypothetical protein
MEINCLPVENAEYHRIIDERTKQLLKPKATTQFIAGPISGHGGNMLAPGTLGKSGDFSSFTVSLTWIASTVDFNSRRYTRDPQG